MFTKKLQKGAAFFWTFLFLFTVVCQAGSFNADRAFGYLTDQCNLGTREPNGPGHLKAKTYFEKFLKKQKGQYLRDDFTFQDTVRHKVLNLTNFHIVFRGVSAKRRLLCAHWDCRPWADRDPSPLSANRPVPGANDGASGVAVLLEICNLLSEKPAAEGVEIVLFDGEDYGTDRDDNWCQGSKHFANKADPRQYSYAILLDMIGDKNLAIRQESNSRRYSPWLVEKVWDAARACKARSFLVEQGVAIYDDHIPLIEKGIPAVDLIDFDYPAWHTLSDTPDQCSAKSLKEVGDVLVKLIYGE